MHFPVLLRFGSRYYVDVPDIWLKQRKTGGSGDFKWQCSANCHLFLFYFYFWNISITNANVPEFRILRLLSHIDNFVGFQKHTHPQRGERGYMLHISLGDRRTQILRK